MKFRNRQHEQLISILLSLVTLAGVIALLLMSESRDEQQQAQAQYCAMVQMYQQDNSTGWPDFNHTYESECEDGQPKAR